MADLGIPADDDTKPDELSSPGDHVAQCLEDLRREIGALRQELVEANLERPAIDEASYRLATQIDLLVSKFIRIRPNLPKGD